MSLEWRRSFSGASWSAAHELVATDNPMFCTGTIMRHSLGKGKYKYQLTVWRRGVYRAEYAATFNSLEKAKAMGLVMACLD